LRLKPSTGLIEIDHPIDTKLNYNPVKGSAYATSLKRSRIAREGGTHGLSGGFNAGPAGRNMREDEDINIKTIPDHSDESALSTQTLGGKIVRRSPGDPIYLLGSFQNNSLHLSHLDAVVQVRPQLHHLDAADELERNQGAPAIARAKDRDGAIAGEIPAAAARPAGRAVRPESKAIDIKLKSSGPSSFHENDLSTNANAKLLRTIQQEPWQTYEWIDEDEGESHEQLQKALHLTMPPPTPDNNSDPSAQPPPNLQSAITNSEWLDLMSAPRIEHSRKGDKGLLAKVRGRERERQRRKRNEAARRERAATTASKAGAAEGEGGQGGAAAGLPAREEAGNATAGEPDGGEGMVAHDDRGLLEPSDDDDDESSEDEAGHDEEAVHGDVDMANAPRLPRADDDDDEPEADDEIQEVQRPNAFAAAAVSASDGAADEPAPPTRRRGRPRKSQPPPADPIVIDD
jgi:RPC5 protein